MQNKTEVMEAGVASHNTNRNGNGSVKKRTPEELALFKDILLEKFTAVQDEIRRLQAQVRSTEPSGDTAFSLHMADAGTDAQDKAVATILLLNQQKLLRNVERALERIENGTFGVCPHTGQRISDERLIANPLANTLMEVKKKA